LIDDSIEQIYYWNEESDETTWEKPRPVSMKSRPPPKPDKPKKPPKPRRISSPELTQRKKMSPIMDNHPNSSPITSSPYLNNGMMGMNSTKPTTPITINPNPRRPSKMTLIPISPPKQSPIAPSVPSSSKPIPIKPLKQMKRTKPIPIDTSFTPPDPKQQTNGESKSPSHTPPSPSSD